MSEQSSDKILELYKLYIEIGDRVSQRREAANRLFAGLLVAVVTAFLLMFRFGGTEVRLEHSGSGTKIDIISSSTAPSAAPSAAPSTAPSTAPSDSPQITVTIEVASHETIGERAPDDKKFDPEQSAVVLTFLLLVCGGGIGLSLSYAWMSIIHSYCSRSVRIAKTLKLLGGQIEFFGLDWHHLSSEGRSRGHREITKAERIVPSAFMFVFILMLLFGLFGGGLAAYREGFLGALVSLLGLAGFFTYLVKGSFLEEYLDKDD